MSKMRSVVPAIALAGAAAVALAGCSSGSGSDGGDGGNTTESKSITLAFAAAAGPTDTPALAALQELEADGWTTDYIEFDSPDVATQALVSGDVTIASIGPAPVMAANAAGADLRLIGNNNVIDQLIVTASDITTCDDLDGRTVAYHSEGSTGTAHLMRYLADNCPDANPNFLVISGSGNRAAALLDGQIDGTIVRLEDWIAATTDGTDANVLATLADEQATLLTQTIVINDQGDDSVKEAATAFLGALNNQLASVNADPAAFAETAAGLLNSSADELTPIFETIVESGMFPETSELSESAVQDTIDFYEAGGVVEAGTEPSSVADFAIGQAAA